MGPSTSDKAFFIQPGNPQQNAYIERCNRTVRYDWPNQHLFSTIDQVQDSATRWLWLYNNERPNTALGGIPPAQKLALAAYPSTFNCGYKWRDCHVS